ncbi:AAA family ATPase [Chitinophaga agri]|uniref:AAA family ATPase n=1 Tax=Chitinophaga agri TaxID=2703787 RepID=A0A6B9ZHL3_9BACT|nr:AAA family ATPase [Chitinophaga agri]QHS61249.1 AAA family ATPase [Chitinophaga agri]
MKISRLAIKSPWKNLNGFSVSFNTEKDIVVLLGKNGSAKSNLLESLIKIFRDIDLHDPSPFSYFLEYYIDGKAINIEAELEKYPKATIDGESITLIKLREKWVPRFVVGYYSGASDRFQELFQEHDRAALKSTLHAIRPGEKLNLRKFIYARPEHGLFALLSFYLSEDKDIDEFLKSHPRIESFASATLVLNKPSWAKKQSNPDNFWGAKGPVGDLLNNIKKHSLAPFSHTIVLSKDFRHKEKTEVTYLHLPDLRSLQELAAEYGKDPKSFFQALDTMRLSELIADFRVRVNVKGANNSIHTRQLSEGEQQLLTVLGLMRFTQDSGSLYILDEPDTHLNPAWGLDYLEKLRTIGGINKNSHTILATHDPLLVAGLVKEEIKVLTRSDVGIIRAMEPEESPRGTGVAGVLTSELYGLESQLDSFSLKVLKRIYEISLLEDYPQRAKHLQRLRKIVPGLAATDTSPDPYRNIAKLAYREAIDLVVKSEGTADLKMKAIERLSALLYKESQNL